MTGWVSRGAFVLLGCMLNASISLAKPANLDKEHVPGQLIVKFKPSFDAGTKHSIAFYRWGACKAYLSLKWRTVN